MNFLGYIHSVCRDAQQHTSHHTLPQSGALTSDQFPARTVIWKRHTAKGNLVILFYKNTNQTESGTNRGTKAQTELRKTVPYCRTPIWTPSVEACGCSLCSEVFSLHSSLIPPLCYHPQNEQHPRGGSTGNQRPQS